MQQWDPIVLRTSSGLRYSTGSPWRDGALVLLQTEVQLYHCVPCGIAASVLVHTEGESCILWAASLVGPLRGEVPAGLCSTSHHTSIYTRARV